MFTDDRLRASFSELSGEEDAQISAATEGQDRRREEVLEETLPKINAYEECERVQITGDPTLQHNVDLLLKLNFFAQRLSEEIAEYAVYDISSIYSLQHNPRARYFGHGDYNDEQFLSVGDENIDQLSTTSNE